MLNTRTINATMATQRFLKAENNFNKLAIFNSDKIYQKLLKDNISSWTPLIGKNIEAEKGLIARSPWLKRQKAGPYSLIIEILKYHDQLYLRIRPNGEDDPNIADYYKITGTNLSEISSRPDRETLDLREALRKKEKYLAKDLYDFDEKTKTLSPTPPVEF